MNWQLFVSSASAIISLASVVMNVWWPHHNRPQADWCLTRVIPVGEYTRNSDLYTNLFEGRPDVVYSVSNAGDGTAYVIKVESKGCRCEIVQAEPAIGEIKIMSLTTINSVQPDGRFYLRVWHGSGKGKETIFIHWTLQPTRFDHRVHETFAIQGKIEKQPSQPISDPAEHRPPLWWWRLQHSSLAQKLHRKLKGESAGSNVRRNAR